MLITHQIPQSSFKYARPTGVALGSIAVAATLRIADPHVSGVYPTCPFLSLTGWHCPGCGSLRALHEIGHFDVGGAISYNVMTSFAVVLFAVVWVRWVRRLRDGRPRTLAPPFWIWSLAGAVVVFGVTRNLDVGAFLAP